MQSWCHLKKENNSSPVKFQNKPLYSFFFCLFVCMDHTVLYKSILTIRTSSHFILFQQCFSAAFTVILAMKVQPVPCTFCVCVYFNLSENTAVLWCLKDLWVKLWTNSIFNTNKHSRQVSCKLVERLKTGLVSKTN